MTPRQKESLLNHLMELDEGIKELASIHWGYSGSFTETQRSLHDLIEICERTIKGCTTNEEEVQAAQVQMS